MVVEHAFPAASVGVLDGGHVMVPGTAASSTVPLAVPSVIVIVEPVRTIVEGVPKAPNVTVPST